MRHLALLIGLSLASVCVGQTYFKPEEHFGLTAGQAVSMGTEKFVQFYCDPRRAGEAGLGGAEAAYALALYDRTQVRLPYYSETDRQFFGDIRVSLADLAKSSVVQGMIFTGDVHTTDPKWSVAMQRSARLVNEAIWQMVRPRHTATPPENALAQIKAMGERVVSYGIKRGHAPDTGTGRVASLCDHILKQSAKRSKRDKAIIQNHVLAIGKLALIDDR